MNNKTILRHRQPVQNINRSARYRAQTPKERACVKQVVDTRPEQ